MVAAVAQMPRSVYELTDDGILRLNFHEGQQRAYWSDKRFVLVLAGTQSGKTSMGPAWLFSEIRRRGPGDYLVVSPTFPLMEIKVIPEFKRFFMTLMNLGDYVSSPVRKFTVSAEGNRILFGDADPGEETHVYFGYGNDPDSLESATYKAAWIDEAGQKKFKRASWDAILRRLAIAEGRVLLTTTPYTLGWLKTELHDKANDSGLSIDVINFPSMANPLFRQSEWARAKSTLPEWKFNMFYRGRFDRPAGLIYDCFDRAVHTMPRFTIPESWPRFLGTDFGGVNTAGVFFAEEQNSAGNPTGRYIGYREYHNGGKTAKQHAVDLLRKEPRIPTVVGGSKSEGQWRSEFAEGGLPIEEPPISDVEVGINRVYAGLKDASFVLFNDLVGTLDQVESYSRPLDERGEPTEGIEDKEMYHYLDAWRYIASYLQEPIEMLGIW
jgi:hypothetical protein